MVAHWSTHRNAFLNNLLSMNCMLVFFSPLLEPFAVYCCTRPLQKGFTVAFDVLVLLWQGSEGLMRAHKSTRNLYPVAWNFITRLHNFSQIYHCQESYEEIDFYLWATGELSNRSSYLNLSSLPKGTLFPAVRPIQRKSLRKKHFREWWFGGHCRVENLQISLKFILKKWRFCLSYSKCGQDVRIKVNFPFLRMLTQLRYLGTQNCVSVTAHVTTFPPPPQLNSHRRGLVFWSAYSAC